jgi:hypothetical protein
MIFCTVTSNKHLFLAKVMANSVKENHPDAKVIMCLVEEDLSYAIPFIGPVGHSIKTKPKGKLPQQLQHIGEKETSQSMKYIGVFDHVVLAKDLGFPNFYRHIFKHTDYEGPGSCKGRLLQYVLNLYPNENKFIYLDSDMKVFGPLEEVDRLLENYPIILTPHLIRPTDQPYPNIESLQNKNGIYNSGFLAIRRTKEAVDFVNWWIKKLDQWCYVDYSRGVYGDQRWLDHVPILFNAYILKHPGYNAAWWNHSERELTLSSDGHYLVNRLPLRCFHFSLILLKDYLKFLRERFPNSDDLVHFLARQYTEELIQAGQNFGAEIPWSYNLFHNGNVISNNSRLTFRNNFEKYSNIENPFQLSNRFF